MTPNTIQIVAALCFSLAIIHTFSVKRFQHLASLCRPGSVSENLFHLLGEVEVVFGIWAGLFLIFVTISRGGEDAIHYLETQDFTEPAFVFVIMAICSTRPILVIAEKLITACSKLLPLPKPIAFYAACLTLGPLMGSFITEPAAMTVTALILMERFYTQGISQKLRYATLGLLFVSISIGGTLTPYAAPPVLMVAELWKWDLSFMVTHFGWKALVSIVSSTCLITFAFRKEIAQVPWSRKPTSKDERIPAWISVIHLIFLAMVVVTSHHLVVFAGIFLFFLGLVSVTREYQNELQLREGLLVAFFLGGLVVLGGPQRWWLEPILTRLSTFPLFAGSAMLTTITDNAALTYLGAQVHSLTEASHYALVAGTVTGGGLTVIANAPNPAGYGILNATFGEEGISPLLLFAYALIPTIIAALCFWFL